jgi:hypothetical protein
LPPAEYPFAGVIRLGFLFEIGTDSRSKFQNDGDEATVIFSYTLKRDGEVIVPATTAELTTVYRPDAVNWYDQWTAKI